MSLPKADIIARLQQDILHMQGFRPAIGGTAADVGLGPIRNAFPHQTFPTGAVHEFVSMAAEQTAASTGFISALAGSLMGTEGAIVWISMERSIFPPALQAFGLPPHRVVFVDLKRERDVLWALEEALSCRGLAAVVGEISNLDFSVSRRLQLAVEQSRVTGFLLRHRPRDLQTTACAARWRITPASSFLEDEIPGVGYPRWKVELLKVRNGKPGEWWVEWSDGRFIPVKEIIKPKVTEVPGVAAIVKGMGEIAAIEQKRMQQQAARKTG
ncbi:ImuA family protein [Chitinophaga lutea]